MYLVKEKRGRKTYYKVYRSFRVEGNQKKEFIGYISINEICEVIKKKKRKNIVNDG